MFNDKQLHMIDNSVSDSESSYDFEHHFAPESTSSFQLEPPQEQNSESVSFVQPPMSNLKTTFQYLDKEGNNTIRKSALKDALMLTSENYDRHIIFQQIEQCGDEINYQKFMDIFRCAYKGDFANQWLFGLYDKDRKGFIEAEDLRRVASITDIQLSEEQIAEMLRTERNGGSGMVDYEDFKFFMDQQLQYM